MTPKKSEYFVLDQAFKRFETETCRTLVRGMRYLIPIGIGLCHVHGRLRILCQRLEYNNGTVCLWFIRVQEPAGRMVVDRYGGRTNG